MNYSTEELEITAEDTTDKLINQIKCSRKSSQFKDEVDNTTLGWLYEEKGLTPSEIKRLLEADGIVISLEGLIKRLKKLGVYKSKVQMNKIQID